MKPQQDWREPPSWLTIPPSSRELIVEDGEPMDSPRHRAAMELLIETLSLHWIDRDDVYIGGNNFLYYSMTQTKKNDFRGPDFYVVLDTVRRERLAWVLWEEDGRRPTLIVELTSESTVAEDHGRKKDIYERTLEIPYYFMMDPFTGEVEAFELPAPRAAYQPIAPNAAGRYPVPLLGLELGIWRGTFLRESEGPWLRWYEPDGTLLLTGAEDARRQEARADEEKARADAEKARADEEKARADREAARAAELERRLAALERGGRNDR